MPAPTVGKLASEFEVVKTQVKELKDKGKDATSKIPKIETRLESFERDHQKNEAILSKLLENTQGMLVELQKQSGALDLIRKDIEHQMADINFVRKKLGDKADKTMVYDFKKSLEQENIELKEEISDLKTSLKGKADRSDIKRVWTFLAVIPPTTLVIIEFIRIIMKS